MVPGPSIAGISAVPREFLHSHDRKTDPSYAPSFFDGAFLTELHGLLTERLADVDGWLAPVDHMKLYEAAFFARGPIVELGRLAGKSLIVLALGNRDADRGDPIYSIDNNVNALPAAEENLRMFGLRDRVTLIYGDSASQLRRIPGPVDVLFIDGDHSYSGVCRDLQAMKERVPRGGLVLVHDYYHRLNRSGQYGVARAVDQQAAEKSIAFRGRFGAVALYERL